MQGHLPDFDTLKELAENDPEALEALRQQHIERAIAQCPADLRRRLQGLQFQIDAKRQLSANPMQSCIEISRMMHESFENLRKTLNQHLNGELEMPTPSESSAQILSFQSPAAAR